MTTHVPSVAHVLAEVNRIRAKHGIGTPLCAMPKGERAHAHTCPLGVSLCAVASRTCIRLNNTEELIDTPPILGAFVEAFDRGAYPELIA